MRENYEIKLLGPEIQALGKYYKELGKEEPENLMLGIDSGEVSREQVIELLTKALEDSIATLKEERNDSLETIKTLKRAMLDLGHTEEEIKKAIIEADYERIKESIENLEELVERFKQHEEKEGELNGEE